MSLKSAVEANAPQQDQTRIAHYSASQIAGKQHELIQRLREDSVVLIADLSPTDADVMLETIAEAVGLLDSLKIQSAFASLLGHRENIGTYFMTVNKRAAYNVLTPHSEGTSSNKLQIAAFYCFENTTDGGETLLFHVNSEAGVWSELRERMNKGRMSRQLRRDEYTRARGLYQIDLPSHTLEEEDEVINESETVIPGLTIVDALTRPQKTHSVIRNAEIYAYWDSIQSIDFDIGDQFQSFLRSYGILKVPSQAAGPEIFDVERHRRILNSGARMDQLFDAFVLCRLKPGELLVCNNMTWTHATNNWTPGSGTRQIAAAFA